MARADPGDGGRPDGPSLDDAGVAQLSDPAAALGAAEATGATAQTIPGGHGMTKVILAKENTTAFPIPDQAGLDVDRSGRKGA